MIRLPLITNPDPDARRTESNLHGASHVGCWLKVVIWMTDFSGSAAQLPFKAAKKRNPAIAFLNTAKTWIAPFFWSSLQNHWMHRFPEKNPAREVDATAKLLI